MINCFTSKKMYSAKKKDLGHDKSCFIFRRNYFGWHGFLSCNKVQTFLFYSFLNWATQHLLTCIFVFNYLIMSKVGKWHQNIMAWWNLKFIIWNKNRLIQHLENDDDKYKKFDFCTPQTPKRTKFVTQDFTLFLYHFFTSQDSSCLFVL